MKRLGILSKKGQAGNRTVRIVIDRKVKKEKESDFAYLLRERGSLEAIKGLTIRSGYVKKAKMK